MTRIVLNRPHTHAGKHYGVRDRLEVDAATADWLVSHGIAALDPALPKPDSELKPSNRKEPKP
ncbi:MAG: hypothetical protein IPP91_17555 [Betaproteobacteria bacterium]|nr:hypothetical protein [Betaproteobacteria bacterium]